MCLPRPRLLSHASAIFEPTGRRPMGLSARSLLLSTAIATDAVTTAPPSHLGRLRRHHRHHLHLCRRHHRPRRRRPCCRHHPSPPAPPRLRRLPLRQCRPGPHRFRLTKRHFRRRHRSRRPLCRPHHLLHCRRHPHSRHHLHPRPHRRLRRRRPRLRRPHPHLPRRRRRLNRSQSVPIANTGRSTKPSSTQRSGSRARTW